MKSILTVLLLSTTVAFSNGPFRNGFFPDIKYESKGHFYLQEHNGRYIFVTPDGIAFYPIGINHLNAVPKDRASQNALIRNMIEWGFNCCGYGTNTKAIGDDVYYIGSLNLVYHGFYHMSQAKFPDVFDASFENMVEKTLKRAADSYHDPNRLIGVV